MKVYIKNKRKPRELKVYVLYGESGQPYDLFLHIGLTTELDQQNFKKMIMLLLLYFILCNVISILIIFFKSLNLLQLLKHQGTDTARINRFFKHRFLEIKLFHLKKCRGYSEQITSENKVIVMVK